MSDSRPTICLNMIVRNEAPVIRRCLASVLPIIDAWVVVDTGSTDGTQDIVRECLKELPGEIVERPWVDFGHNRTEALNYARGHGSYVLVIDADEVLEVSAGFSKADLTADAYLVDVLYGSNTYLRKQLLRNDLPWRFVGVVHESAACDESRDELFAAGLRTIVHHDGARARDPHTYRRDALLLEAALLSEPANARYVFYLAQSYRDAGDFELAVRSYRRRVEMGGWGEEVWCSLFQIADLRERTGHPWGEVMQEYLAAFQFGPGRAEPLYRLGMHYQRARESHLARLFFSRALPLPRPARDCLFVDKDLYDYQLLFEYAAACGAAGAHPDAIASCNRLLRGDALPPDRIERVLAIRKASVQARLRPVQTPGPRGRITIAIPFRDPGQAFDDCVESVLAQKGPSFEVVFIDDGSQADYADRIPHGRPGYSLLRNASSIGLEASLDRFIATQCGADDVVIPLSYAGRFASSDVVQHVSQAFAEGGCHLLYGQHRLPSGALGDAEPAVSEADFLERRSTLTRRSLLAFRAQLWTEHASKALDDGHRRESDDGGEGLMGSSVRDALMTGAGFLNTRFSDEVLTIVATATRTREPDARAAWPAPTDACPGSRVDGDAMTARAARPLQQPMVSCLMVTCDRLALAKRAIRCYATQTYSNRELVIVSDGELRVRRGLERFVAELGLEGVRFVYPDGPKLTLGQLRNVAIDAARGEVLCQWDDDDCYHPDRITVQVEQMLTHNGRACCLTDHLQFLADDRALVWVDWTLGGKSGKDQLLPGTIVMFKDDRFRYPESGPFSTRGEDSMLLYDLYDTGGVVAAKGMGHLYLYTYHGRNTFDRSHHYRMSLFSRSIAELKKEKDVIRGAMAHYPVPKPYLAVGCDGPAFVLND